MPGSISVTACLPVTEGCLEKLSFRLSDESRNPGQSTDTMDSGLRQNDDFRDTLNKQQALNIQGLRI